MSRFAITSRTSQGSVLRIITDGKVEFAKLDKMYKVIFSDEVTDSMKTFSRLGLISYAEVNDGHTATAPTRRSKKDKVTNIPEVSTKSDVVVDEAEVLKNIEEGNKEV